MPRKILLIEPNYNNKFPPVGLMKISTYHKLLGDEVVFFKGEIKDFILDRVIEQCISKLDRIEPDVVWKYYYDSIKEYIKTKKNNCLASLPLDDIKGSLLILSWLDYFKDYYHKKEYLRNPEWDRIFITSLFTFYFDVTVKTINDAKPLLKKDGILMVGGVLASIQPEEIEKATGIKPHQGLLHKLDDDNDYDIDTLPLDYTILDEVAFKYEMSNAYYAYTTRGCIRKCKFCAVPKIEPQYVDYIPLKERIEKVDEICGEQLNLLLMDNNILASKHFDTIIQDIVDSGFEKGNRFLPPNELEISLRNLKASINDRAYIRKTQSILSTFYNKIKDKDEKLSYNVFSILMDNRVIKYTTSTKENTIKAAEAILPYYNQYRKGKSGAARRMRIVDFNQGVDARLFTPHIVEQLAKIEIRPLRIAFDDIKTTEQYLKAVRLSANAGIKDFSNYLLYNFTDNPIDLYKRLRINVELCDELNVNIYSFPMKYHPLQGEFSHNRDFIGEHWNKKYIRAVQAILNCTKGQIGRGLSYFLKAFGENEDQFLELLEMPECFILYRFFFEWLNGKDEMCTENWRKCWHYCKNKLSETEWNQLMEVIHSDTFSQTEMFQITDSDAQKLLGYYRNCRNEIATKGTRLYDLKLEYDKSPTKGLKRHHQPSPEL